MKATIQGTALDLDRFTVAAKSMEDVRKLQNAFNGVGRCYYEGLWRVPSQVSPEPLWLVSFSDPVTERTK